jgi:hypothetical protein
LNTVKKKSLFLEQGSYSKTTNISWREVPNPLHIDVCRGRVEIGVVLNDLLALTKLNYNTCIFSDGIPVTLRFADAVGEILTAGPLPSDQGKNEIPLPFRHYI